MTRRLTSLRRDGEGAAAAEFALAAPVFLLLLLGLFDLGHMAYSKALLNGVVEKAARSASLENGNTDTADAMVENAIKNVLPSATFNSRAERRKSYYDYGDVGRAEKFTDTNGNGTCDPGEPFVDENRSGLWEADVGKSSNGSANDVVIYTVTVTYKPIFAVRTMAGYNENRTLTAVGMRKNQPYANQQGYGSSAGTCA